MNSTEGPVAVATDFDALIDRGNTNSTKYDFIAEEGYPLDVLPMWLADMDFQSPACIRDALSESIDLGIFGYTDVKEDYIDSICRWFSSRHDFAPDPSWLVKTPGVVYSLTTGIRATSEPGDAVLIQPPVYYPFSRIIRSNGRRIVTNELVLKDGRYTIDLADFERRIVDNDVKTFLLCSPHNPVGRVWTTEELASMGEICLKHNVFIIADEIHCDLVYPEYKHQVFLKACPEMAPRTILCTAPSKTFNLAGLQISNTFIPDEELRERFISVIKANGLSHPNSLGYIACQAGYDHGAPWLDELIGYVSGNLDFLREQLKTRIPGIRIIEPEGTYLVWLDCSGLGFNGNRLDRFLVQDARLWLDFGPLFGGTGSNQFERINIACPRSTIVTALDRLTRALDIRANTPAL